MAHPEQPRKGNDEPKEVGNKLPELLKKGAALFGADQLKRQLMGSDVLTQLTNPSKNEAIGKTKEVTKKELEKAEKQREDADKICKVILNSGILNSPEYKKFVKSFDEKIAVTNAENDNGVHAEEAVTIKGKDGKRYSIEMREDLQYKAKRSLTSVDKFISFYNDKHQLVTITSLYTAINATKTFGYDLMITIDGNPVISARKMDPTFFRDQLGDEQHDLMLKASNTTRDEERRHIEQGNKLFDQALAKKNIKGLVQKIGEL